MVVNGTNGDIFLRGAILADKSQIKEGKTDSLNK